MVRILCYGDSNTWGANPNEFARYDETIRYPKVLQTLLGEGYEVIEEGLCGRTINIDDEKYPNVNRNGVKYFGTCVLSHDPLDYIVIMLGSNDLKAKFGATIQQMVTSLKEQYIELVQKTLSNILLKTPQFILVAPCEIKTGFCGMDQKAESMSKQFYKSYKTLAQQTNSLFVSNKGLVAGADGLHLTPESHMYLAKQLKKMIIHNV